MIPSENDQSMLEDPIVAGRLFDHLLFLRSSVGLYGPVFVIACTYKSWRVFWLEVPIILSPLLPHNY